jgi:hypothetical protein
MFANPILPSRSKALNPRDPTIISACLERITAQLNQLLDQRARWRQYSFVIVGAMLGFCINEQSEKTAITMCVSAIIVSVSFWMQDQKLHRYQHSWRDVDSDLRHFIRDGMSDPTFKLMHFKDNMHTKAHWYSLTMSAAYLIQILGAILLLFSYGLHWF